MSEAQNSDNLNLNPNPKLISLGSFCVCHRIILGVGNMFSGYPFVRPSGYCSSVRCRLAAIYVTRYLRMWWSDFNETGYKWAGTAKES